MNVEYPERKQSTSSSHQEPFQKQLLANNMAFSFVFAELNPVEVLKTNAGREGPLLVVRIQKLLLYSIKINNDNFDFKNINI